ncbi:CRISPR-associated protein, TM1793 family [Porphyromonas gingivalis W83]|uniref:CRISPR-associated protein, TM1793 family n=1 Tax=Porphyromonas gingivalis (strain ATCC BAA-308 / W83) TaxID=242619 RepID=Q7MTH3_PORGI|nr:type III-B CRISPR module-associated protein Cmr3 [Porphyromonas gingivalis]AAQ66959.1 CRISPR-associated protein, TM1793 family [Porphyromonas gingivalis W83]AKV65039.1 CRISPR-associated protein, Cmr3 family [Porphyromonas gingivalis]AUR46058.1 CRISPR-associated RAMP Cmr3 [Porphyromonas gingivalis]EIW91527.1 CRISPR type III-B/RAMP module-associated protein Cmr3 [Porphyromonas gingivalis W50]USI93849.1 type III-B CRISPR module-associated protein Cmr3 [Porphyromonas gingivalis]
MSTYLIKLTPLDKFFFGQKKTFGDDNANYFVYSSLFPQQTTLLGLLRYQLLQIAGEEIFKDNKIQDEHKAGELIGKQSFSPFVKDKLQFGIIQSLSPVFIIDKKKNDEGKEEYFLPVGRRFQKENEKAPYNLLHLSCQAGCPPIFGEYKPKKGLASCWLSSKSHTLLNEEDFFTKDERIGIRKDYEGATNDDAFFCQRYYRFKNFKEVEGEKTKVCKQPPVREHDFCFAVLLETHRDIKHEELNKRIVYLGGERQPFLMDLMEVSEETFKLNIESSTLTSDEKHYTVVLLSDAMIEPKLLEGVKFASTEVKDFACLLTHVGTRRFYNKKKKREEQNIEEVETALSHQHELYARGSVFYFDTKEQANQFCEDLEKVPNFHTIGYNHAIIIEPTKTKK